MADPGSSAPRRGLVVAAYGLFTGLLLHDVASDLPWVGDALAQLGGLAPDDLRVPDDPQTFAVLALATLAATLALGAFLVSRRTGTGFGLLAAASLAWTLFPYAEIPLGAALGGPTQSTPDAPASVWVLAGAIALLATLEIGLSAREQLLAHLDGLGLDAGPGGPAARATRQATVRWLAAASLVGVGTCLAYALVEPPSVGPLADPDLLWAPVVAGLLGGLAVWLWSRTPARRGSE